MIDSDFKLLSSKYENDKRHGKFFRQNVRATKNKKKPKDTQENN